jgi:hypothetical protein
MRIVRGRKLIHQKSHIDQGRDQRCPRSKDRIHVSLSCIQSYSVEGANVNSPTYYERFKEAFVNEVNTFTDAVLDDKRSSVFGGLLEDMLIYSTTCKCPRCFGS